MKFLWNRIKKIKLRTALRVVVVLAVVYIIYALLNFAFRPSSPWTLVPKDQPQEVIVAKREKESKEARSVQLKTKAKRRPKGILFVTIQVEGHIVQVREKVVRGREELVYPQEEYTVSEFAELFEKDRRYYKAYFTWIQEGDEMYDVYEKVKAILGAKVSSETDESRRPHLREIRRF